MKILKKLLAIVVCICLFCVVLHLGGYSFDEFATSIGLKNPSEVFDPLLPDTTSGTDGNIIESNDTSTTKSEITSTVSSQSGGWFPDDLEFSKPNKDDFFGDNDNLPSVTTSIKDVIVNVGSNVITVTKDTVTDFIKWLQNNYKDGDSITVEETTSATEIVSESTTIIDETISSDTISSEITSETISEPVTEPITSIDEITVATEEPITEPTNTEDTSISEDTTSSIVEELPPPTYNNTLQSQEDLQALINDIEIVDTLPEFDGYDRTEFEKPVKSYKYNGKKYNRNDYSWKTSPWLISEEPFQYKCPYTGKIITDDSKLDFDHITPLKSAYLRGANKWTEEQMNAYAYDQWIGVDVLNSANRSKSDKGPEQYLPNENIEDYCYSWILICSRYDLVMTDEEIDICTKYINEAISIGEPVTHLGGVNP